MPAPRFSLAPELGARAVRDDQGQVHFVPDARALVNSQNGAAEATSLGDMIKKRRADRRKEHRRRVRQGEYV